MGRIPFLTSRLNFLQTWTEQPTLTADAMVTFELYPWHIATVKAACGPTLGSSASSSGSRSAGSARRCSRSGAPWFGLLEDGLGLQVVDRLGAGGRLHPTQAIE